MIHGEEETPSMLLSYFGTLKRLEWWSSGWNTVYKCCIDINSNAFDIKVHFEILRQLISDLYE